MVLLLVLEVLGLRATDQALRLRGEALGDRGELRVNEPLLLWFLLLWRSRISLCTLRWRGGGGAAAAGWCCCCCCWVGVRPSSCKEEVKQSSPSDFLDKLMGRTSGYDARIRPNFKGA